MTIETQCRNVGWGVQLNDGVWEVAIPFRVPVRVSLALMPDRSRYRCFVDSVRVFEQLTSSFAVDVRNCPARTFRSDRSFVEDGTFFGWLKMLLEEEVANDEISDAAAELRAQSETERNSLVSQRKGQAALRKLLMVRVGSRCMATGVTESDLLVASHIKGWSECKGDDGRERLDIDNVLLLAKNVDGLFDRHYISFDPKTGNCIVSRRLSAETLRAFGLPPGGEGISIPRPNLRQSQYLEGHLQKMRKLDNETLGNG